MAVVNMHEAKTNLSKLVQRATGIRHSVVNGVVAFTDGEPTGQFAGRVLVR